jgi:hypothetical protein
MSDIIQFADGTPGGIIEKDDAWYFADRQYCTNSMLSELEKSPLHLKKYLDGIKDEQSQAYAWGSAFHCIVLEPDEFISRFYVLEDSGIIEKIGGKVPRNTKAYKEWKTSELEMAGNRTLISGEEYDIMHYLRDKIYSIAQIKEMLNACAKEKIMADEYDGIKRKCKADAISYGNFLIDLKTTSDPVSKFSKSFRNYNYDRQMAYYKDICGVNAVYVLAIEKSSPNTVGWFEVTEDSLETGRTKYDMLLQRYKNDFLNGGITNFDSYYLQSYL